jgi:hypothetical protein
MDAACHQLTHALFRVEVDNTKSVMSDTIGFCLQADGRKFLCLIFLRDYKENLLFDLEYKELWARHTRRSCSSRLRRGFFGTSTQKVLRLLLCLSSFFSMTLVFLYHFFIIIACTVFRTRTLGLTWPTSDEYKAFVDARERGEPHERARGVGDTPLSAIFGAMMTLKRFLNMLETRYGSSDIMQKANIPCVSDVCSFHWGDSFLTVFH